MILGDRLVFLTGKKIKNLKIFNFYRVRSIEILIFLCVCFKLARAESSKYCNLIGSESGRYFTILLANPGGIVGSFIQKFVFCLSMSKNRHFQTISLLKLALLLTLAREK